MHQVRCDVHGGNLETVEGTRGLPKGWLRISISGATIFIGNRNIRLQTIHKDLCPECIEGIWGKEEISKETADQKFVRYIQDYFADLAAEALEDAMENV